MMKRAFLTVAAIGLFGFLTSDTMAAHGHRGHHFGHQVQVGHGYQWHGNHIDHVDTYWHNGHYDTVRHHGRPLYYNSYYGGGFYGGYGGGYSRGYGGCGGGYGRSGVSVYFGF